MDEPQKPKRHNRPTPRVGGGAPIRWITNKQIARQLKKKNFIVANVYADIAGDRKVDAALRLRALDRVSSLLFGPNAGGPPDAVPQVDVGAMIAGSWTATPVPSGSADPAAPRTDSRRDPAE